MPADNPPLRDFIYLDVPRMQSLAAQLDVASSAASSAAPGGVAAERLFSSLEPVLMNRSGALRVDSTFDVVTRWTSETFSDGQFVHATGVVRLLDFDWLSMSLSALPAVLRKMSKLEMEALRNSDEGRRMSKSQLQQRSQENQVAISRVEEFKADELGDVVRRLYPDLVRVKVRPRPAEFPQAALVGTAHAQNFYDGPAALSQKYGIEIDAGWTVVGQLNVPNLAGQASPVPTGNRTEDSFEQIALLMNNAFRVANSPAFPAVSFTPIAIYRAAP
jgi:hypothetical protein